MMNPDSWLLCTYVLRKTKDRSYKCSEKTIFLCCKQELRELSQLTFLRSRWMSLSHGHTPPSVDRCKCHWQQCPLEYQYSRIRRSLKQMTFPILFHSFFLTWHLFSHAYIHIKASNSNSLSRHISMMGMEKTLSSEKRTLKPKAPNLLLLSNALNCCSYVTQPDSWLSSLITLLHRWKGNSLKERIKPTVYKAPLGPFNILCTSFVHMCLWDAGGRPGRGTEQVGI